jgi:hypothetical protein
MPTSSCKPSRDGPFQAPSGALQSLRRRWPRRGTHDDAELFAEGTRLLEAFTTGGEMRLPCTREGERRFQRGIGSRA